MAINPKENLQALLQDLFQLDKTDLDFGIYRILNLRSDDVKKFIYEVLPKKLDDVARKLTTKGKEDARALLETAKEKLTRLGVDITNENNIETDFKTFGYKQEPFKEAYEDFKKAKKSLIDVRLSEDLERDIYNDLYRFFERYYEQGDFISMPRAGDNTYMIPYNGEEVKFYWANHDQYYIKTGENFKNYIFTNEETLPERKVTVEFKLINAETTINNNQAKKGRLFIPTEDYFKWDKENKKLSINFYYKIPSVAEIEKWGEKQTVKKDNKGINEQLVFKNLEKKIRETKDPFLNGLWVKEKILKKRNGKEKQNIFYYHINRYTAINSFDFFIHKDLRKFLMQELDYFLKHEILSINFISTDWSEEKSKDAIQHNLLRAGAIRDLAFAIIDFLSELENFQKMLFEKKKFVTQNDYCITLDLVPDTILDEIINYIINDKGQKQLKYWLQLEFIDTLKIDSKKIKNNKYLVIDTQNLSIELKDKLLSNIENIDEQINGLIVNSENFQAINLILSKYKGKVKAIYADPPYNTSGSEIIYKNSFKHSTWLSLIDSRASLSKKLLDSEGIVCFTIDDFEFKGLKHILDLIYDKKNFLGTCVIRNNPAGRSTTQGISITHEYALFYGNSDLALVGRLPRNKKQLERYDEKDNDGKFEWVNFRKPGSMREESRKMYYPLYVSENKIRIPNMVWDKIKQDWIVDDKPLKNELELYPIDENGQHRRWRWGLNRIQNNLKQLKPGKDNYGNMAIYSKGRMTNNGILPPTFWHDSKYSSTAYGTNLVKNLFLKLQSFPYPKSLYAVEDCLRVTNLDFDDIVIDFFAGSGTTGHAIINLNKLDEGNRKYILIEMGEYFDTVTKPRLQKIIYSDKWKKGRPEKVGEGTSHIFQYIKLEQYEDTLNNILFDENLDRKIDLLVEQDLGFHEIMKYIFWQGSNPVLSIEKFLKPFEYKMEILDVNEKKEKNIDLITTFNFLLGLNICAYKVEQHQKQKYYITIGKRDGQEYIVIWRSCYDKLNYEEERNWVLKQKWYDKNAIIYANADNAFGAHNIELEFKRLMFEQIN